MREIKFRAIDRHSNKWVYGIPASDTETIDYSEIPSLFVGATEDEDCYLSEIVPGTLGQYTGLKDKNGKEIYEGDIVLAWSAGHRAVGEVKKRIDGLWIMYPAYQKGKFWGLCPDPNGETSVEIIGNIRENPELLEVHP